MRTKNYEQSKMNKNKKTLLTLTININYIEQLLKQKFD